MIGIGRRVLIKMTKNTEIIRIDRDVQTYEVPLPTGGIVIIEYATRKPGAQRFETLSMKFPGDPVRERLDRVCLIGGGGIHTTPSIAERYNELPEEVRNAVMDRVSPEAKNLLWMI